MFIEKTEPISENEVDDVIDMDIEEGIEENLARAVEGIVRVLGIERPSEEKVKEALTTARTYAYTPAEKEREKGKKTKKEPKPRYFGLLPEIDLEAVVGSKVAELEATHPARIFWQELVKNGRVASRPHITLVHSKSLPAEQPLWDRSMSLHCSTSPPTFNFQLSHLLCNDRVMAIAIADLEAVVEEDADDTSGVDFVGKMGDDVKQRLHITVGTAGRDVNPFEARGMVAEWRNGKETTAVPLGGRSQGRVKGLMS